MLNRGYIPVLVPYTNAHETEGYEGHSMAGFVLPYCGSTVVIISWPAKRGSVCFSERR